MKNKTLEIASNLLNAGISDDKVKKLLNIDERLIMKAKKAVTTVTLQSLKDAIQKVKSKYVFFPEYTISHKATMNSYRLITSNNAEMLDDLKRYIGGELREDGLYVNIKQE